MLGQQLIGQRGDRRKPGGLGGGEERAVPDFGRGAEGVAAAGDQIFAALRGQPHEVAHPDIVQQAAAIAQLAGAADQPFGCLIGRVVIGGGHGQPVRRDDHVADFQHGVLAFADDITQFGPALCRCGKRRRAACDIAGRDQRDEHPVDIAGVDRIGLGRQNIAARKASKIELDQRIAGGSLGIVPQPDIPGARLPGGITALDRQNRAVDRIERDHSARAPAKRQPGLGIVAIGGIG